MSEMSEKLIIIIYFNYHIKPPEYFVCYQYPYIFPRRLFNYKFVILRKTFFFSTNT